MLLVHQFVLFARLKLVITICKKLFFLNDTEARGLVIIILQIMKKKIKCKCSGAMRTFYTVIADAC